MPSAKDRISLLHLRVTLADAIALIDQGLPGSARVTLPSALSLETEPSDEVRKHRQHLPSDFARIGGRALRAEHTAAFSSPWWRDAYRPGAARELFVTCCYGQKEIGQALKVPIYHVGICEAGEAWKRIGTMKRRSYGSGHFREGGYVEDRRNWTEWFLGKMSDVVVPSPNSPVVVTERGLVVRLPEGFDGIELDTLVMNEVRKGSLATWLRTEEGRSHCRLLGVDPGLGQRFTAASVGTGGEPEPVDDITMRPQHNIQARLIHIVEQAVLAHLRCAWPEAA